MNPILAFLLFQAPNPAIYLAISENGRQWRVIVEPVTRMAQSPDAVALQRSGGLGMRNDILLYVVNSETGAIEMSRSSNAGATWSERSRVMLEHPGGPPAVVIAPDGTLRMFLAERGGIALFQSKNGLEFERVGMSLAREGASLPEVVRRNDKWVMYFLLNEETRCAESEDGVNFAIDEAFRFRGSGRAGGYIATEGTLRVFFAGNGIWSRVRRQDGSFANETGYHLVPESGTQILNPSPLLYTGGRHFLFCEVAWIRKDY